MLDVNLIYAFLEVAKSKNLNAAAQRLFITQSALSQRIKALEGQIGTSLFLRRRSGMELNQFGQEFYDVCFDLRRDIDSIRSWVMNRQGYVGGKIEIATISGFVTYVFPDFFRGFIERYPNVSINIEIMVSAMAEDKILKGQADVGIMIGECKKQSLKIQKLCDNHVHMVCSPDYFLAKKKRITNDDIEKAKFIWHADKTSRSVKAVQKVMGISFEERTRDIFISDMDGCKNYAIRGLGVTFVARMCIKEELKSGKLISLPGFDMNRPAYIISRNEKYEPPLISAFKKEFAEFCAGKDY